MKACIRTLVCIYTCFQERRDSVVRPCNKMPIRTLTKLMKTHIPVAPARVDTPHGSKK